MTAPTPKFKSRGFYLHACWHFNYPFAVRSWERQDYAGMFRLLHALGLNRVMLWPMMETLPPPLAEEDVKYLGAMRTVIDDAHQAGLECWITCSPNLTSRPEIRAVPIRERHFYPYRKVFRLDDLQQFAAYAEHLEKLLRRLNNADGYVFIDGDPGGYPGAAPRDFVRLFHTVREIVNRVGTNPNEQKVIPWIWCGWGTDWETQGAWKPDLQPLVEPVLQLLKSNPPGEPWELLPGRSMREGWANGRINFALTEEAGLMDRSTLMTYEIIEYEPTAPAVVLQFDDIRRVIRQELRLAVQARGIMGNAQQPIMSLPNLFFFGRAVADPAYLDRTDDQVLADLAEFLGGPVDLLIPAWSCLRLGLDAIPSDLPAKLRTAQFTGEPAAWLPGSPQRYLRILADFVETRLTVLQVCASAPPFKAEATANLVRALAALAKWWNVHRYVYSGEGRQGLSRDYLHPQLFTPLAEWIRKHIGEDGTALNETTHLLADNTGLTKEEAAAFVTSFRL